MADLGQVLSGLGEMAQGYQQYQGRQQLQQLEALRAMAAQQQMQQHARQAQASALMWPALQQLNQQPSAPMPGLAGGGQQMPQPDYSQGAVQSSPMPLPQAQGGQMAGLPDMPSTGLGASAPPSSFAPTGYAQAPSGGYYDSGLPSSPASAPPQLKRQILALEGNKDYAVGKAGELGPGQILPSTGQQYGYGPDQLVGPSGRQASGTIVDDLYRRSGGDLAATKVGYNRGPGAMDKFQRAGDSLDAVPNLAPAYKNAVRQDIIQTGLQMRQQGVPGQALQQSSRAASDAAASIDPAEWGRASLKRTMDAIDKAAPGADPTVKLIALQQIQKLLAPDEKMMAQLLMAQNKQQHAFEMEELKQSHRQSLQQQSEGFRGQMQLQQEQFRMAQGAAAGGGKGPRFGSVDDLMRRWHEDFMKQQGREPTTDEIAKQHADLARETRPQSQAMRQVTQRLQLASNEVSKAVESITALPYGTTLGLFGGGQAIPGPGLAENMRKTFANAVTPQSAQVLKALTNGVTRGLAILESGGTAQGLVGLGNQLQGDLPQANDTGLTIAAKFADIRQIVEAATEVLAVNPDIQDKQQELLQTINQRVISAIPFTTTDVARLVGDPSDETLNEFAQRIGLGGPKPGTIEDGFRLKGGDFRKRENWEKVQ